MQANDACAMGIVVVAIDFSDTHGTSGVQVWDGPRINYTL
jgi:hypothetical protein